MRKRLREILERMNLPQNSNNDRGLAEGLGPHEIDGDIFPEGVQEYDATETLPNPLDTLTSEEVPKTRTVPSVITARQALLGRIVSVPVGGRVEIISLRTPDEELSSTYTVYVEQLGRRVSPAGNPTELDIYDVETPPAVNRVCHALIEWGVGSVQHRTFVDIVPGQALTVAGTFIRVIGFNDLSAVEIEVSAMISLLPRASRKVPQFTRNGGVIGAAATVGFGGIPPFARSFKVCRTPNTAPFTIRLADNAGGIVCDVSIVAGQDPPEIDLPGNVASIVIVNGATQIDNIAIIYYLDL